ncbi:MAG: hypothetical protein IJ532_09025 [Alphaproteobacteria bacterium]|nr:hypothetical protein [Alphaproteobacteria bacterium]
MSKVEYFVDKQSMQEIGFLLWKTRRDKHFYLEHVAKETGIPTKVIEGIELGKYLKYGTVRRLLNFYGKEMKIVFE